MNIYNTNFDFTLYKAFYAVAEQESFSKAAEVLHLSQPAISYSIKKLEEELGVKLVTRFNKKIKLTDAGNKLKFHLEIVFNNLIIGYKDLQETPNILTGEVTIGIHSHVGEFLLPRYIKNFSQKNPAVKIIVFNSTTEDLKGKFRNKEIDILILHCPVFSDERYYEKKLFQAESCFFSNRNFFEKIINSTRDKHLDECPLILPIKGFSTSKALEKFFFDSSIPFKSNLFVYTTEMMKGLVREGAGIGWAMKESIRYELENNIFFEIFSNIKLPILEFSIVYDTKLINYTALEFAFYLEKEIAKNNISF